MYYTYIYICIYIYIYVCVYIYIYILILFSTPRRIVWINIKGYFKPRPKSALILRGTPKASKDMVHVLASAWFFGSNPLDMPHHAAKRWVCRSYSNIPHEIVQNFIGTICTVGTLLHFWTIPRFVLFRFDDRLTAFAFFLRSQARETGHESLDQIRQHALLGMSSPFTELRRVGPSCVSEEKNRINYKCNNYSRVNYR